MNRRWTRISASILTLVLGFGITTERSMAQSSSGGHSFDAAPQSSYVYDDQAGEELILGWQFRFQADWVAFKRVNRASSFDVISGPESFSFRDVKFDYTSGVRLNLGFMNDDYELEGSYFRVGALDGSLQGTLNRAIAFDGAASAADPLLGLPSPTNFLGSRTFFSTLNTASQSAVEAVDPELEHLEAGALYVARYDSKFQDFDVNFKGRRQPGRMLRFGMGYRNIQFNELAQVDIRGTFDSTDQDGNATDDGNNGLSDASLTGTGLTLTGGASGFTDNGFPEDPLLGPPDTLLLTTSATTFNQMNGIQATMDATFIESDYFEVGGFAKAGIFHNYARGTLTERVRDFSDNSIYSRTLRENKDRASFAVNLGVNGTWYITESIRGNIGYEAIYLYGVALAPDQARSVTTDLAGTTSLDLRTDGNALMHGIRIGFDILFP